MGEELWARSKNYKENLEFPAIQIKRFEDYQSGTEYGPEIGEKLYSNYRIQYQK